MMGTFYQTLHRDSHGIPASDKIAVLEAIKEEPRTVGQLAEIMGLDPTYTKRVVKNLDNIGMIVKVGRHGPKSRILWGVKA